jgi:hypothetical protein
VTPKVTPKVTNKVQLQIAGVDTASGRDADGGTPATRVEHSMREHGGTERDSQGATQGAAQGDVAGTRATDISALGLRLRGGGDNPGRDEYLASIHPDSTTGTITWQSHLEDLTYFARLLTYNEWRTPCGGDEITQQAEAEFTGWLEERAAERSRAETRRAEAAKLATAAAEKER